MRVVLAFLLLFCWPGVAAAGDITYEPAPGCPTREAFAKRLADRAPRARNVDLKIHVSKKGFEGEATVGVGDDAVARKVEGRTCDAVVEALLLAVALDKAEAPPPVAVDAPPSPPPSPRPSAVRSPIELGVGIDASVRGFGVASLGGLVGPTFFVEARLPGALSIARYRPSVRVGIAALASPSRRELITGVDGDFGFTTRRAPVLTLVAASIDVCPLAGALVAKPRADLVLGLCSELNIGSAGDYTRDLWIDAGGIARAALVLGNKEHTHAFLDLSGGLLFQLGPPLGTPSFARTTSSPINVVVNSGSPPSTPAISLAIGGGVIFP